MHWEKQKPIFVVFEGGEGSGKTTQAQLLCDALKRAGRRVIYNKEPGSTEIGFKIRVVVNEADLSKYPDLIFLLDGNSRKILKRVKLKTSFEKEDIEFHNRVRKGFLTQAKADKKHWVVFNAFQSPAVLHRRVWERVSKILK